MKKRRSPQLILGFLALALVFSSITSAMFISRGVTAMGEVVGSRKLGFTRPMSGEGREGTKAPIIEFKTRSGERVRLNSYIIKHWAWYERGEQVEVIYSPDQPESASINSFYYLWYYSLLSGAGLLGVGIWLMMGGHRRPSSSGES